MPRRLPHAPWFSDESILFDVRVPEAERYFHIVHSDFMNWNEDHRATPNCELMEAYQDIKKYIDEWSKREDKTYLTYIPLPMESYFVDKK